MFFYTYNWYLAIIFEIFIKKNIVIITLNFYDISSQMINISFVKVLNPVLLLRWEFSRNITPLALIGTAEQFRLILTIYIYIYIYTKIHYNKKNSKKLRKN